MVRDYELMYIVRPDLDDDGVKAAMDSVQSIVESNGGTVVKTTPWGKRRLAYEIQKLRDGHYVLLEVRLDGARVKEVERTLRIHDQVFRHMVVTHDHAPDGEEPGGDEQAATPEGGTSPEASASAEPVAAAAEPVDTADTAPAATAEPDVQADEGEDDDEDVDASDDEEES